MAHPRSYEKHKHLINTKINNWTILDIIIYQEKQHVYALAQCHCGTIKEVRLTYIMNNRTKDCGCGRQDRLNKAAIDQYSYLIGTTINKWKVLKIIPPNKTCHNSHALCECQCGTIREVNITYLLKHKSKDCGCGRKQMLQETRTKSLIGQRFGKLVVVEMLDERNKYGRIRYKCKCDCGQEVEVLGNSLASGHTLSCGCLTSYWNMYIKQFLETCKIKFRPETVVHIDKRNYRFDFYLPDYNLFIEYDGQQHYHPVRFFGSDEDAKQVFERTQESDRIKNRYCEENNINLLRIPYWETKNIEIIINNCLQRLSEKGFAEAS